MPPSSGSAPKVFCSHRSIDKIAVRDFARRLRERGIDAWVDEWEIAPGDDLVARINEGLATCQAALIFFSLATASGLWVTAEISAIIFQMIEDGTRVIPVMIDDGAPVPPLLRPRARRGIDELDAIIDAIRGLSSRPLLGPPPAAERSERLVLRLSQGPGGALGVTADRAGRTVAQVPPVAVPRRLPESFAQFLEGRMKEPTRGPVEVVLDSLENGLATLGEHLGAAVFPGEVGAAVAALLDQARVGVTAELVFEAPPRLLSLPFEAARLADGRLPALAEGVCVLRRLQAAPTIDLPAWEPAAGPLKILVAVGAPDEGQTPNQVLDLEAEVQAVLDAVERANRLGNAQVRILEVGHPDEIRRALTEDAFHVLHLSAHGLPGAIELETEDGAPCRVGAADFARSLRETGRPLPLVFLSACHGGVGGSDTASFAQGLLEAGVVRVVAMQGKVSDPYATRLAGEFYGELTRSGDRPLASRALARARRTLERERLEALRRGEPADRHQPEYATSSLFCLGDEGPILDLARDQEPLRMPPVHRVEGPVPQLSLGELIGRRRELRELLRVLRDDPRRVAAGGRRAGVVLTGMGGAGKSCLAGRAMARLKEEGWSVAAVRDRFDPGGLTRAVADAIREAAWPGAAAAAAALAGDDLADMRKLALLGRLLTERRLVLIFDNFETNLTVGGAEYRDIIVGDALRALCEAAGAGKLLVTCRYPLPGLGAWLHDVPIGPLSAAETQKLLLRLRGFEGRDRAEVGAVLRRIGGHPRMLEYVDALVRGGEARLPRVRELLDANAREAGVNLAGSINLLDDAAREALLVGAQDILLEELLHLADTAGDGEVLRQAAVSALPLSHAGLARALHGREPSGDEVASVRASARRLVQLSLLTPSQGEDVWVHRWTAESLRGSAPAETHRERCRRAGEYRIWRVQAESGSFDDGMEAVENFLEAEDFDRAGAEAVDIAAALARFEQLAGAAAFAGEVIRRLPEGSSSYAALMDREAAALIAVGYTERARESYARLLSLLQEKVRHEPGRADYQRDLSVSYNNVGDVQRALGEGEAARASYERSLSIRERLAASEPGRADYQRDLSVSYDRMGDVQRALGEGEAARASYERSLSIMERLAASEPGRADYQRDLSVSCDKLARLAEGAKLLEDALGYRRRDLGIAERLWAAESGRADLAQDLAISLLETARLDPSESAALVRRAVRVLQPLAAEGRLDAHGARLLQRALRAKSPQV